VDSISAGRAKGKPLKEWAF